MGKIASYPGSSPAEKRGESLEELITCPVTYYGRFYACMVLIIELLPTQSVVLSVKRVMSADTAVVAVLDVAETTDRH